MSALHWIHRSDAEKEKIVYMDVHPIGALVIIVSLVILNALITAADTAIDDVNKNEVEKRASEGNKRAKDILYLQKLPGQYINILRILILILSIAYSLVLTDKIWVLLIAYGFIMFSVLYPRKLAMYHAETYSYRLAKLLKIFIILFKPLLMLINMNNNLLIRITGINPLELIDSVTEDEIISIVNEGHEQGVLEAEEAEMISNIIDFNEKIAADIMTHRLKIAALDSEMTMEEALSFMMNEKYTRFPIYQDNIDNIIGIIHLRDVMMYYMDDKKNMKITEVMREPYFVPDTQKIDVLFRDMQSKKVHIAIIFDEFGQTVGVAAMEDILEEIVGDIQDEYDEEADLITAAADKEEYIVKGEADLEDLAEIIGINFDEEDLENFDTVNGFIISKLEHIPKVDEIVQIEYYGFCFDIEEIKNNVIQRVRIYRTDKEKLSI